MSNVDALWGKLSNATDCKSLLKRNLTPDLFRKLKGLKTRFGGTLADCIRSGCLNLDSGCGIYASDPDAYTVFAPVLDKVIKEYHKVPAVNHPEPSFFPDKRKHPNDNINFPNLDPSGTHIVSTRVRVGRSHDSYGFPPVLTKEDRIAMEKKTVAALNTLDGELAGKYYPLTGMSKGDEQKLIDDHFLFKNDDRFLRDANGYDDWPTGRGIFHTPNKRFRVWVNEEDHLRLISMQMGGDLSEVYQRLVKAINTMEKKLTFAKKRGLGYLTFCPTNLGTTLRASVHMRIPLFSKSPQFQEFCAKVNIQPRGIHGEHTESVGGVYDLSNKRRLGLTEWEAIKEMKDGVLAILAEEKKLEAKAK